MLTQLLYCSDEDTLAQQYSIGPSADVLIAASLSINIQWNVSGYILTDLSLIPHLSVCLSVGRSVGPVGELWKNG